MKESGYPPSYIDHEDEASWIVTYADMMTLLLVFFVLLFTLASFDREEYRQTVEEIKQATSQNPELQGLVDAIGEPRLMNQKIRIDDLTGLRPRNSLLLSAINTMIQTAPGSEHLSLDAKDGKIIITVSGTSLFVPGSARLFPSAKLEIDRMVDLFQQFDEYTINIKGHTDDIPISTPAFPSNWELSAIRATTVLKHLVRRGVNPERLTATGYGDVMPRVPNTSDENRAKNRRVEFVLEKKNRG